MDHIPHPPHGTPLPDVPLFERYSCYNYESFENFLRTNGIMDHESVANQDDLLRTARSFSDKVSDPLILADVIQSWLIFSVLASCIETPFLPETFSAKLADGRTVLTLKPIENIELKAQKQIALVWAWSALDVIEQSTHAATEPVPTVALAVRTFLVTLEYLHALQDEYKSVIWFRSPWWQQMDILKQRHAILINKRPQWIDVKGPDIPSSELLKSLMQKNGRCPHRISRLFRDLNYLQLCYVAQMKSENFSGHDHSDCDLQNCQVNFLDTNTYEQRHVARKCAGQSCSEIHVAWKSLARIIDKGKIPLVRVTENVTGLHVSIEEAVLWSRYTAISHPWSDGMGNPRDNSLHECQLQRLIEDLQVVRHTKDPYFELQGLSNRSIPRLKIPYGERRDFLLWIDTLCIPARGSDRESESDKEQREKIRRRAIEQMAAIYASAEQVLVVDENVRSIEINGSNDLHTLAAIVCSTWGTRAWTFQEGAQSMKCYIRVENTVSDARKGVIEGLDQDNIARNSAILPKLWAWNKVQCSSPMEDIIHGSFEASLHAWFSGSNFSPTMNPWVYAYDSPKMDCLRFVQAWNQLSLRETTNEKDKLTVLAMSLELPLHNLLSQDSMIGRMRCILFALDILPRDLLYQPGKVRQNYPEQPNNFWIPELPQRAVRSNSSMAFGTDKTCLVVRDISALYILENDHDQREELLSSNGNLRGRHDDVSIFWIRTTTLQPKKFIRLCTTNPGEEHRLRLHDPNMLDTPGRSLEGYCILLDYNVGVSGAVDGALFTVKSIQNPGVNDRGNSVTESGDTCVSSDDCAICQERLQLRPDPYMRERYEHRRKPGTHYHPWTIMTVSYVSAVQLMDSDSDPPVNCQKVDGLTMTHRKSLGPRDVQLVMLCDKPEGEDHVLAPIDRRFALYPDAQRSITWIFVFILSFLTVLLDAHFLASLFPDEGNPSKPKLSSQTIHLAITAWLVSYAGSTLISLAMIISIWRYQSLTKRDEQTRQLRFLKTHTPLIMCEFYPYWAFLVMISLVLETNDIKLLKFLRKEADPPGNRVSDVSNRPSLGNTLLRALLERPLTLSELLFFLAMRAWVIFDPRLLGGNQLLAGLFSVQLILIVTVPILTSFWMILVRKVYHATFSRDFSKHGQRSQASTWQISMILPWMFFKLRLDKVMVYLYGIRLVMRSIMQRGINEGHLKGKVTHTQQLSDPPPLIVSP